MDKLLNFATFRQPYEGTVDRMVRMDVPTWSRYIYERVRSSQFDLIFESFIKPAGSLVVKQSVSLYFCVGLYFRQFIQCLCSEPPIPLRALSSTIKNKIREYKLTKSV